MAINSSNYHQYKEQLELIEDLLDKAHDVVNGLQNMHNELDEVITNYDNEQSALDE